MAPVAKVTGHTFIAHSTNRFTRRGMIVMATWTAAELDDEVDTSGDTLDELLSELIGDSESETGVDAAESSARKDYCDQQLSAAIEDAKREGILFFDIETVPDETRFPRPRKSEPVTLGAELDALIANPKATVPQFEELLRKLPIAEEIDKIEKFERAGKNRAGVFDAIKAARTGGNPEFDKWAKLSVNPIGCRIVAFGWSIGGKHPIKSFIATTNEEEQMLLRAWWALVEGKDRQHCGFNTNAFDLTVLMMRSSILKVRPSRTLSRKKYDNRESIDIYRRLFPEGYTDGCDCKSVCRAHGINIPAGDMDGSKVLDLWDVEDWDTIARYVESDVTIERELFYRTADVFGS